MATYAIVEAGGKQYRAEEGAYLLVDRMPEDEGAKVGLRAVMFRNDDDTVLEPGELAKVKVEATITGHERGEKIKVFKYKAKKGYRKHKGHRSELTRLQVTEVKMLSRRPAASSSKEQGASSKEPAAEKPAAEKKATAPKKAPAKKPEAEKKAAPKKKPAAKKESD